MCFENYFDSIDCEDKAYWLGFIVADGCVMWNPRTRNYVLSMGLQGRDAQHLEQMARDIGGSRTVTIDARNGTARLVWYSKRLVARLIEIGIRPRKSAAETVPAVPDPLARHFWRGVFDGDGMLTTQIKAPGLVPQFRLSLVGSREVLTSFQDWARSAAGARMQKISKAKNSRGETAAFVFYMNGNRQLAAVTDALYRDSTRRLQRKYLVYCQLLEQNARVRPSYRRPYTRS